MIKSIYQIAVGPIPEVIADAMATVKALAEYLNVPYVLDTELPEQYRDHDPRIASNYMRIDRMISHPGTLYMDWDCIVHENFTLDREQILVPYIDNIVFLNVKTATRCRAIMGNIVDHPKVAGSIFSSFRIIFKEAFEKSGTKLSYKDWLYTESEWKDNFVKIPVTHFKYTMDKKENKKVAKTKNDLFDDVIALASPATADFGGGVVYTGDTAGINSITVNKNGVQVNFRPAIAGGTSLSLTVADMTPEELTAFESGVAAIKAATQRKIEAGAINGVPLPTRGF